MTLTENIFHKIQRYRHRQTNHITRLPIVILMPHSACNCRCVMCDIWKGNKHLKQLTVEDVQQLILSLKRLGTRQVLFSGGEALLNSNFFKFCELLSRENIRISLLSTGMTLARHAAELVEHVDEIIVSLDGDEPTHNMIRNIPDAFKKLEAGVKAIKSIEPGFRITSRTVIHQYNFRKWIPIIDAATNMGIDQVSFLPADVSSQAFNREIPWTENRQSELLITEEDLTELDAIINEVIEKYCTSDSSYFIAENPGKLKMIGQYYAAFYHHNPFPFKKCNAPWVSTVVEVDGTVRHCFFHSAMGNIHEKKLEEIINSEENIIFRKNLDTGKNDICKKCVCSLYLSSKKIAQL